MNIRSNDKTALELFEAMRSQPQRVSRKDVQAMLDVMQTELLCEFRSSLFNAAYSSAVRQVRIAGLTDGDYRPLTFSVETVEPRLSGYEALGILRMFANAFLEIDESEFVEKWIGYLGKAVSISGLRSNYIDDAVKRIDRELQKLHRRLFECYKAVGDEIEQNPKAKHVIEQADEEAQCIRQRAKERSERMEQEAAADRQHGVRLRAEAEAMASDLRREALDAAAAIRREAEDEAQNHLETVERKAAMLLQESQDIAAERFAETQAKTEQQLARARAAANEIRQQALNEKNDGLQGDLKQQMSTLVERFSAVQAEMAALENRFAQYDIVRIFDTFYALYETIDQNRKALKASLPSEYGYIADNMEIFLEIIQESLAEFGIQTVVTAPGTAYDVHLHQAEGAGLFDPSFAVVNRSVRAGFRNRESGSMFRKEIVLLES